MAEFRKVLQRAVDRGEVRADNPAAGYVLHMMIGGFVARTLIDELPPTRPTCATTSTPWCSPPSV